MRVRYTKEEREQAALLCAIAANSGSLTTYDVSERIAGTRHGVAAGLADRAWHEVHSRSTWVERAAIYAEAEAMIRNGEI